eukprot:gene15398-18262_t
MDTIEDNVKTPDCLTVIQKLKDIIMKTNDQVMIQAMRSTLKDIPYAGKIVLCDEWFGSKVASPQSISFVGRREPALPTNSYFSPTPQQVVMCPATPPGLNISSGSLPPLSSSTSTTSLLKIPPQPTTSHTFKTPIFRRQISKENINSLVSSISQGISSPNTTTTTTTTTSPSSINNNNTRMQPTPSTATNVMNSMRRSPSMPDLEPKTNRPNTTATTAVIQKGPVSTISPSSIKDDPPASTSKSVRPVLTKSASMGAMQRENTIPNATSLEEMKGQIYNLSKYQAGCRFIQSKLEETQKPEHVTLVFEEVYEHLVELMTDPYGQIAPQVHIFACHNYGTHGIQKILGYLSNEQVVPIINSISDKVNYLAKDSMGRYLLETFLKTFTSPDLNQFIYNGVMENIDEMGYNKVGCTIINKCIDHATPSQLKALEQTITDRALNLVQDNFGNYIIQSIVKKDPSYSSVLIASLSGYIAELSVQKHSSNVIEKCLQVANPETYEMIIDELTSGDIGTILQDKYANFVIQTALDVANEEQHTRLVKLIVPYIHIIKTPYVIHIQK